MDTQHHDPNIHQTDGNHHETSTHGSSSGVREHSLVEGRCILSGKNVERDGEQPNDDSGRGKSSKRLRSYISEASATNPLDQGVEGKMNFSLRSKTTTAAGQLKENPHFTYSQAQQAAKKEYNRRNAARARIRSKFLLDELQDACARQTKQAIELENENAELRNKLNKYKELTSIDIPDAPKSTKPVQTHDALKRQILKDAKRRAAYRAEDAIASDDSLSDDGENGSDDDMGNTKQRSSSTATEVARSNTRGTQPYAVEPSIRNHVGVNDQARLQMVNSLLSTPRAAPNQLPLQTPSSQLHLMDPLTLLNHHQQLLQQPFPQMRTHDDIDVATLIALLQQNR